MQLGTQTLVGVGVVRPAAAGEYELHDRDSMERLAPFVRRAFDLHLRLAELEMRTRNRWGRWSSQVLPPCWWTRTPA